MLFMTYAQVKVFARKGRNWIQTTVHISFYWKRHVFTIRVQTVGPVPHCMFRIVAATIVQHAGFCLMSSNAAFSLSISWALVATAVTYTILLTCPQRKNQGAEVTDKQRSGWFQCMARASWYMRITQERRVCEYMFLQKKWSSLHDLSSLSFCRWGPVTPCIYVTNCYKQWKLEFLFTLCSINLNMASISGTGNVQSVFNLNPCVMKHVWCDIVGNRIKFF